MRPAGKAAASEQEYPYGWRYVKRVQPDGTEEFEQVALTLEDVLHPQEGDVISENRFHESDCTYLAQVFRSRPLAPPCALVTRDLLINWGVAKIRNHSPDVGVFTGLDRDPGGIGTLDLRGLHGRCLLVIEVVSPNTRNNDVVHKFSHYHTIGIPLYVLIDQQAEDGPRSLRAFRWEANGYVEIPLDAQGRVFLPPLGLFLAMRDEHAVCFDAATGEVLGDYSHVLADLQREREQREAIEQTLVDQQQAYEVEVTARQDAQRLANDARLEADKHRHEADKQRHEADKQRQEVERAQQEADKQRQQTERAQQEADKQRQEAERAQQEADKQRQEADKQRQEADKQRQEADKQRHEADKQRQEAERAQQEADKQRQQTERAQQEADKQRQEAERAQQEADKQRLAREVSEEQQELLQQAREQAEKQAEDAARRIRDLEEALRRLQNAGGEAGNPTD